MTYEELTVDLPVDIANAFILSPGYIGADSLDLEHFIETVWKAPVTIENYKAVAQAFRRWYRVRAPDEYHDPPSADEMRAVGYDVGGHTWIRPGRGAGGGRKPGPGPRNKPRNPHGVRIAAHVTFDPDIHAAVKAYAAEKGGLTFSAAINAMLSAI